MSEYQLLESNILSIFKDENLKLDEENSRRMEQLVDFFNKYWKTYQDKWTPKYWQTYESLHEKNNNPNKDEISNIFDDKNEDRIEFCNESILADNLNKNNNNFCVNNIEEKANNNLNSKENLKFNSTNHQTKTFINLQDIDEELEKINDVSLIKEKKQQEKRRNCFECLMF